jgi:hypothetical protein
MGLPHGRRDAVAPFDVEVAEPGDMWFKTYQPLCCGRGYVAQDVGTSRGRLVSLA